MNRHRYVAALLLGSSLSVLGCGVTYKSPTVEEDAAGLDVQVVPLTASSVQVANRSPYKPLELPAAYYSVAANPGLRSYGAMPTPSEMDEPKQKATQLRLPPSVSQPRYRIGKGDVLLIATKSAASTIEGLSGLMAAQNQRQGYSVRDDGKISIPDIGQIRIDGLTLEQAETEVFQALVAKGFDPSFSLEISEFNSQFVAFGGAVGRAGLVPITLKPLRLGEALAQAGGISTPSEASVTIRLYRNGSLYHIPLKTLREDPKLRHLILLPDDAVYVDRGYDIEQAMAFYKHRIDALGLKREARTRALAELDAEMSIQRATLNERRETFAARSELDAEARDYVYMAGEVTLQRRIPLPYGRQASLADLLYDKGGFDTTTGDPTQIYVLRAGAQPANSDTITAWHLDASNIVNMTLATRMEMRPNDIVFIEEQIITKWSRAFQQAFPILVNKAVEGSPQAPAALP